MDARQVGTPSAKIAFVDDDENLLSSHRRNFARLKPDWEADYFTDPAHALTEITAPSSTVTAVILDIHMPGMTGLELAAHLREKRKDLIVVMLTGYADLQSALSAINDHGVFRFYPKPTALQTILDGIDGEIERRHGSLPASSLPTAFLDLFEFGLVAADENLAVSHMNAQAAEIIGRSEMLSIGRENRLMIDAPPENLGAFLKPDGRRVPRIQQSFSLENETEKLSLFVRRMANPAKGTPPFLLIFVEPEQQRPPAIDDLMDLFGLTRSEAKLAQKLAEGLPLEDAAATVGISRSSARTYLKSIFSKTGVNRQPQLMRTVLSTIPSLRH